MKSRGYRDLIVYQKSFGLSLEIYKLAMGFPKHEQYGLTSQIIRSSRSVCACIGEAYRKRRYKAHFISKLTDADMENTETMIWLEFAQALNYINNETYQALISICRENGLMINPMINHPEKFTDRPK